MAEYMRCEVQVGASEECLDTSSDTYQRWIFPMFFFEASIFFITVRKRTLRCFDFDYKAKNKGDVSSRGPDQRPAVLM